MIETILSIVTTITSIVAIAISVKTLKQNSIMIENSTRPYIQIYGIKTSLGVPTYTLVVKNFGQSSGTIKSFKSNIDLAIISLDVNKMPFSCIENTTLAPTQSLRADVNPKKMPNNIVFDIEYQSATRTYKETININFQVEKDITLTKTNFNSSNNKEDRLKEISYSLQEFLKRYF